MFNDRVRTRVSRSLQLITRVQNVCAPLNAFWNRSCPWTLWWRSADCAVPAAAGARGKSSTAASGAMVGGETIERKLRQIYDAFDNRNPKVRLGMLSNRRVAWSRWRFRMKPPAPVPPARVPPARMHGTGPMQTYRQLDPGWHTALNAQAASTPAAHPP